MLSINFIFFTITISRRVRSSEQTARDAHVSRMMREVQEKRDEYTRFLL